ncbi:tail fiber protein [Flavobacterium sp. LS1R49]|uniref:Tail fiber protein n=1 Tax=Flavobacterium shii TaxID=2987687 RepID=A0A9X2ZCT7_9FLAO|nr:tail fiber protein [Flavobacterium shii]MCV9926970.1 tail fiber protein [Flavobacterium shii]
MNKITFLCILFTFLFQNSNAQDMEIPSFWASSKFKIGTGDGASLTTYNAFLSLHSGLGIGSPFVYNANGEYINKATIVFDGRTGDINSLGSITANLISSKSVSSNLISSDSISSTSITSTSKLFFPTFNNYKTNCFVQGTGDGASLTTYNTFLSLHSGLGIGSPYVNGSGGYTKKATIVFDGRTGNIITQGLITANKIHSSEIVVDLNVPGPDYVFENNYNLEKLEILEKFIATNKHLPEIPSAIEMKNNGVNVVDLEMKLLQKIEELTLYMIEQNKQLKAQNEQIQLQNKEIQFLKKDKS